MFYEILKASKGLPVTDHLAALWGQKIAEGGAWQLTTITGTLPLSFRANGKPLTDYRIYGTEFGAGVKTENLFDYKYYFETAVPHAPGGSFFSYVKLQLKPNTSYTIFCNLMSYTTETSFIICPIEIPLTTINGGVFYEKPRIITTQESGEVNVALRLKWGGGQPGRIIYTEKDFTNRVAFINLVEGSTAPESYIPYGYKLPLKVTADGATTDYPIYIGDSKLTEGEYVDYGEQKIYKLVDGVLTSTDPPVPLPEIALPKAKATIDIEGDVKPQAAVIGEIKEI